MSKRTAIGLCVAGVLLLIGAGVSAWKAGPHAEAVCTRAADKVILCIERTSRSAADMSRQKRDEGIPACAQDPAKVEMYVRCLEHASCEDFMQCAIEGGKAQ